MIVDLIFRTDKETSEKGFENSKASEKPVRSIVKAFSWRVIGTLDTIIISYIITGEVVMALSIGSIELITKMVLYFFHERIWNIIRWGKQ